ncbi:hypothetical protein OC25_07670 [Pedobacter kyungheensis]|uniref:DUF5008 domain-containing protein n=1 Tax=Pedobacter kyungheensis TaxID=1069985 RepID=A0A0C1FTR4_9SPHI|nr:DUF5008 domain-containing protein [Pedobacter kyungheensis]KIA95188.1 hypothetical protein OC25_07670 [Pedobacter kyungheensis]
MKYLNYKYKTSVFQIGFFLLATLLFACKKNEVELKDPYANGKESLGIQFRSKAPSPAIASSGDVVDVNIRGLLKYKDKFKLYVNELEAEVLNYSDSTLQFKVPLNASTGGIWVTVDDASLDNQTFFGPTLQIAGKTSLDAGFQVVNGSNYTIYDILRLASGGYILAGAFTDFENKATKDLPVGNIAQINAGGAVETTLKFGIGANYLLNSAERISSGAQNGKFLIAGNFSSFNTKRPNRANINSLTRLNVDGTLDSTIIDVVNATPNDPSKNRDTVPSFNGGVQGTIKKIFTFNDQVYAVGNFDYYLRAFYERSTYDAKVYDRVLMRQMVRMDMDGSMDQTFHYNAATKQSPNGANGIINDAIQLPDGKLILAGTFTSFNGISRNRLVRINLDGSVDATFNIGTGADDEITSITYNATTKKILVAGPFKTFNGQPRTGVAMLETDGSLTAGFTFPSLSGGIVNYAGQLNNGKIIVAGSFNKYRDILRQGFMVLNTDGTLASGYNNTGVFQGTIEKMIETTSTAGNPAIILVGNIFRFDNIPAKNIIRVELLN